MHCGFRRDQQLECLVRYRTGGNHRYRNADECVYEDSAIVVFAIEHWHARGVVRIRVTCPMRVERTTTVMVGCMVVWMGVRQGSAHCGTLDGHRQRQRKRLPNHGDIVGERGHLVKRSRWAWSTREVRSQMSTAARTVRLKPDTTY
jgi:hypothetical protein